MNEANDGHTQLISDLGASDNMIMGSSEDNRSHAYSTMTTIADQFV